MTYGEALRYLLSLLGDIRGSNFGLERMERLMARLGHPERSFQTIHIAGTNGKGSTAAFIEAGLRASGKTTGLYTSPHLARFNERLRLNGAEASDAAFAAAVEEVRAANEWLVAREGRQAHPTFFESVTAVAFCGFRHAAVDWGVVEVGLGGRLDATNVVDPTLAVITPIELDHERFLGKGKASIAAEKAGILKPGARAVVAPQRPEAWAVIEERAKQLGVEVIRVGRDWQARSLSERQGCYRFEAQSSGGGGSTEKIIEIAVPLAGEHQVLNALTAVASLDALGVPTAAISRGIERTEWPGRLERLPGRPEILLDAAHNPASARSPRELSDEARGRPPHPFDLRSRPRQGRRRGCEHLVPLRAPGHPDARPGSKISEPRNAASDRGPSPREHFSVAECGRSHRARPRGSISGRPDRCYRFDFFGWRGERVIARRCRLVLASARPPRTYCGGLLRMALTSTPSPLSCFFAHSLFGFALKDIAQ